MNWINYHKHTYYSNLRTLDVIASPESYIKYAAEIGQGFYSTCEHGFQGNIYEAQTLCEKYGIKPIYAVEAYMVRDRRKKDRGNYHLMLIAMTKKGQRDLNKTLSVANEDGYYFKPRIDMELLLSLSPDDVVVTSACIASCLFKPKFGFTDEKDVFEENAWETDFLIPMVEHFGKSFYLEVQDHPDKKQIEYNKGILTLSNKYGCELIHGCDSHYIHREDAKYRNLFLHAKGIDYPEESGFILDYPSDDSIILDRYKKQGVLTKEQAIRAISNTNVFEVAEPIYTDKEFKIPVVPNKFIKEELGDDYDNTDNDRTLKEIIRRGWNERKKNIDPARWPEYEKALDYEFDIIQKCGMASYFILNHIITKRAVEKYHGILTRSGRGSAVSFLTNYMLGLTEVDRLKAPTKLYPTRFMSAERILQTRSIPDIDKNWASVTEIIRATKDVLGDDMMYYMIVYKPLQRSSAFRLWCKAKGYDISDYEDCAKLLSDKHNSDEDVEKEYPNWKEEIENSKIFRGVVESMSPSPCSFLLSNEPISELTGLIRVGDEKKKGDYVMCSCLDGYNCDQYKFLKNDELIVKVYKLISETYKLIGKPIDDISTLMKNCDDKVWNIYAKGLTTTINQVDSDSGKKYVSEFKPHSLREMAAFCAAIRPGFAPHLDEFIHRKPMTTGVKELDDQLEDSFHSLLYQENIMTYLIWLGVKEKDTYDIIKKISKKKFTQEQLDQLHEILKKGWIEKLGNSKDSLEKFENTWASVKSSAKYAFNSSHSLSVAVDSIYGAYLKSHYPLEYFTVCFNNYLDDSERTTNLTNELPYFDIKIKSPKFKFSGSEYRFNKEQRTIYKGLASIKSIGAETGTNLLQFKDFQGDFVSLLAAIKESKAAKKNEIEILIKIGFFSEFGNCNKLLYIKDLFEQFYGKKNLKKSKADELGIDPAYLVSISQKETKTQYMGVDMLAMIRHLADTASIPEESIVQRALWESQLLGYISITDPSMDGRYNIVTAVNDKPNKPVISLYCLKNGKNYTMRCKRSRWRDKDIQTTWKELPLQVGDFILLKGWKREPKPVKVDGEWRNSDELEWILSSYALIKRQEAQK